MITDVRREHINRVMHHMQGIALQVMQGLAVKIESTLGGMLRNSPVGSRGLGGLPPPFCIAYITCKA